MQNRLENFSIRHRVGFARSLSCHLIVLAAHDMKLDDAQMSSVQHLLQPLFVVKAVSEGAASPKEEVDKTIKSKMQLSEVKRLDPIQCAHAWCSRARQEGAQYDAVIDAYLLQYREEATSTQSISDLEEKVIKIIPSQTDALQEKLAYH
jgi:hypothetical protein